MRAKPLQLACALAAAFCGLLFWSAPAAASVQVDSSFFTAGVFSDSRTTVGATGTGNGLIWNPTGGAWSGGKFSIMWMITDNGSDFTYQYTVKTPGALGGTGAN